MKSYIGTLTFEEIPDLPSISEVGYEHRQAQMKFRYAETSALSFSLSIDQVLELAEQATGHDEGDANTCFLTTSGSEQTWHDLYSAALYRFYGIRLAFFSLGGGYGPHRNKVLAFHAPSPVPLNNGSVTSFGGHIDELKAALSSLSDYLRGINDPDVLTQELKTARSFIDASLCFFDEDKFSNDSKPELPAEIAVGLKNKLKDTDWSKTSSEARGWVQIVIKFFEAYWKSSGV